MNYCSKKSCLVYTQRRTPVDVQFQRDVDLIRPSGHLIARRTQAFFFGVSNVSSRSGRTLRSIVIISVRLSPYTSYSTPVVLRRKPYTSNLTHLAFHHTGVLWWLRCEIIRGSGFLGGVGAPRPFSWLSPIIRNRRCKKYSRVLVEQLLPS